ncbi:unnamed protein product, partial [Meganyctiphanes norvegica]
EYSVAGSCPNYKFTSKHVCATCVTNADALEFAKEARGDPAPSNVPLETVFDGHDITYTADYYDNEDSCLSNNVKTWNCYHDGNGYWTNCKEMGLCTSQSAMVNGHFWPESLDCQ